MNGIDIRLGYTNLRGILGGKRTIRYKSISDILISMFSGVNKCPQGRNIFVIDFGLPRYRNFVISLICVSAEFPAYNGGILSTTTRSCVYVDNAKGDADWRHCDDGSHNDQGDSRSTWASGVCKCCTVVMVCHRMEWKSRCSAHELTLSLVLIDFLIVCPALHLSTSLSQPSRLSLPHVPIALVMSRVAPLSSILCC